MTLDLILKDVTDPIIRENFYRIQRYIAESVLLGPDWKFIETEIKSASYASPVPHGLNFTPTDIIPLSVEGDYNYYFRVDESDKTNVYVANHGPVRLRFLVGNFPKQQNRKLTDSQLAFVAPNISDNSGTISGSGSDGWAFIQDSAKTPANPLLISANTRSVITNNGLGSLTNYTNAPSNSSTWWDQVNSTFRPSKSGEFYTFKLNFQLMPSQNNASVLVEADIGTGNAPYASTRFIQSGAGKMTRFSLPIPFPVGPGAFQNGVKFFVTPQCDSTISNINLTIIRDFHL